MNTLRYSYVEHYTNPVNAYYMSDADAKGEFGTPDCGDHVVVFLKIKQNCIKEISFLVFGCCGAIATTSVLMKMVKGKTLQEASQITGEEVFCSIDGIPPEKAHCSNLGIIALKKAIVNYLDQDAQKED